MSNVSRFDDAALEALCVDNGAPTLGEISKAKEKLAGLVLAASNFLYDHPVNCNLYARQQDAFPLIRRMMEKAGWTYCGSGYYSAAFFRNGLAIKIGMKAEDSGLMYAAWCRANQGRAGVPTIHKLISHGTAYAVLMDRLEAIGGELDADSVLYDAHLAAEVSSVKETINLGVDGWGEHMELCRTAIDIREFFMDIANFDIHEANVMLDRDGNLIITDPVSFVGDYISGDINV